MKLKNTRVSRYFLNALLLSTAVIFFVSLLFFGVYYSIHQQTIQQLAVSAASDSQEYLNRYSEEITAGYETNWLRLTNSTFVSCIRELVSDELILSESNAFYARMLAIQNEINTRFTFNDVYTDVAIMIFGKDRVYLCGSDYISDDLARDYANGLFTFSDMNWNDFKATITAHTQRYLCKDMAIGRLRNQLDSYDADSGLLVSRYSYEKSDVGIYAILQVNIDRMRQKLSAFHYAGDYFMIADKEDVLFTTDASIHLDDIDNSIQRNSISDIIYVSIPLNVVGLTCHLSLSNDVIYGGIKSFTALLDVIPYVFILLIILLALLFFFRWHYPVIRIAQNISEDTDSTALNQIHSHITTLTAEKQDMLNRIDTLEPTAQRALLRRMYIDEPLSPADITSIRKFTRLTECSELRCICIGCLEKEKDSRQMHAAIKELTAEYLPNLTAQTDISGLFAAVLPGADTPIELPILLEKLNSLSNMRFSIGISDAYIGSNGIAAAYQEAHDRWRDTFLWQHASINSSHQNAGNRYNVDYEHLNAIYQALRKGNIDLALQLFDQLVQQNFRLENGYRCKQLFCQQFYFDIVGIIARISTRYDVSMILDDLSVHSKHVSMEEQIFLLRNALQNCAGLLPIKKENSDLSAQVLAFCEENFANPTLSLTMVAESFKLSESGMSKFFKAHTGVTFSAFIESLRLQKAESLLAEGQLSVRAISESVGYQNTTTFYNAFKRKHNCTPTQWLELQESADDTICQS